MPFDKTQALAVLNGIVIDDKPIKLDPQRLSDALDELFRRAADKTIAGVDFHVYGGTDDHTSDLDERVIAVWLVTGIIDAESGLFREDEGHPSVRVPVLA